MPADRPRRHHYVPKWYLTRFARAEKIWMFDTKTNKVSNPNVGNVAAIGDFYRLPADAIPPGEDEFSLEREFSKIESHHSVAIERLVQTASSGQTIESELRLDVAHAVAFQWLRTEQSRNITNDMFLGGLQDMANLLQPGSAPRTRLEEQIERLRQNPDLIHLSVVSDMTFVQKVAIVIAHHKWVLLHNRTQHAFVTTDSPTPLDTTSKTLPPWMGVGVGSPGARVLFPLSPDWLLWTERMVDPMLEAQPMIHAHDDVDFVKRINAHMVHWCERWVFSRDNDFGFINELMLKKSD